MTLSPPPVEPAHAPTKLIKINTVTIKLGHDSNVVLVKPEVVMNDTVWNRISLNGILEFPVAVIKIVNMIKRLIISNK